MAQKINFAELMVLAAKGATIGDCADVELGGVFIGYPEDFVQPDNLSGFREVIELVGDDDQPAGRSVFLREHNWSGEDSWENWLIAKTGCTRRMARDELIAEEGNEEAALINIRHMMKVA